MCRPLVTWLCPSLDLSVLYLQTEQFPDLSGPLLLFDEGPERSEISSVHFLSWPIDAISAFNSQQVFPLRPLKAI